MTTDPGDLVLDPTCGSGTTAYAAEQWGRRWITCDTSRVAVTLAKQRLMTAVFDYYELAHPEEGVGSGFNYRTVPHITLGSIANNPDIREGMGQAEIDAAIARHAPQETLYDQPQTDNGKRRVTGPFSVEAVPAPAVLPIGDSDEWIVDSEEDSAQSTDHYALSTIPRSGETLRQSEWRDELLKTGIRGKGGQFIRFARLEALPGCRWLHADGESRPNGDGAADADGRADADDADRADADGADLILSLSKEGPAREAQRVVVSFGPEHGPLAPTQVESAIQEARTLVPRPRAVVFAAFQFDPEASKDIDETNWPGLTLLKAQMNADLLTEDLKRQRASNESFWLVGQPDVVVDSEEWIVNSTEEALAPYDVVAKLSGLDSLAEINGLGRERLSAIIAVAERGDLWDALATDAGGSVDPGQHSGGIGPSRTGGVPALSGSRAGFPGRIGDAANLVRQLETLAREQLTTALSLCDETGRLLTGLVKSLRR